MTTRDDQAALKLVTFTLKTHVVSFSQYVHDYSQKECDEYYRTTGELEVLSQCQHQGDILCLQGKEVRPGLWALYMSTRANTCVSLQKYKGFYTTEAKNQFIVGWDLKYS